jgi:hypothetical protein
MLRIPTHKYLERREIHKHSHHSIIDIELYFGIYFNIYLFHCWNSSTFGFWGLVQFVLMFLIRNILVSNSKWHILLLLLFKHFLFYCCTGWGYTVSFTNVLTIYQIYHTWIHPLHHSWNSLNTYHFSTFIHVYTEFAPYSPSYTFLLTKQDMNSFLYFQIDFVSFIAKLH